MSHTKQTATGEARTRAGSEGVCGLSVTIKAAVEPARAKRSRAKESPTCA